MLHAWPKREWSWADCDNTWNWRLVDCPARGEVIEFRPSTDMDAQQIVATPFGVECEYVVGTLGEARSVYMIILAAVHYSNALYERRNNKRRLRLVK